jgi:hypothetical protein
MELSGKHFATWKRGEGRGLRKDKEGGEKIIFGFWAKWPDQKSGKKIKIHNERKSELMKNVKNPKNFKRV